MESSHHSLSTRNIAVLALTVVLAGSVLAATKAPTRAAAPADPPVGTIMAYAGPIGTIPANWLLCDGSAISRAAQPLLFAAIGTTWGGDANPNFFLPDLRGEFLRGVDKDRSGAASNPAIDPDRDARYSFSPPNSRSNPGNGGNNVGSFQRDTFASHTHGRPVVTEPNNGGNDGSGWHSMYDNKVPFAPTSPTGGSETRPRNAYVYWIIRAS